MDMENGNVKNIYTKDLTDLVRRNGPDQVRKILRGEQSRTKIRKSIFDQVLINATGAWASLVSELYGFVDNDVKPRRRQLELISCPELDLSQYGMIIDTSDIYFHKEGEYILVGYSNMDEPYGVNFRFDFYDLNEGSPFIELIWKPLWKRISKFEKLKFIRGWAGIYGETPDKSGFFG